jgi:preprotein translocase subunit SecE
VHGPKIYKRAQGKYTRVTTVLAVLVLSAWGCFALAGKLDGYLQSVYLAYGIPLLLFVLLGWVSFWFVNRPRSADFLIATEGEMKKVSWSSRKEVIGSTKVVIVTTFILAALLFLVDFVFATMFKVMGVTG